MYNVMSFQAIVYALIKKKSYGRKRAWEIFHKGVRLTKREKLHIHNELIEGAKNISDEDRELYEERYRDRMRAILGPEADDLIDYQQEAAKQLKGAAIPQRFKLNR